MQRSWLQKKHFKRQGHTFGLPGDEDLKNGGLD